jgi:L-lactate dehydrogenase complex protein LldG
VGLPAPFGTGLAASHSSAVAIAETGTIVLDAGPTCGRRIITLVPDMHVCVADVVESVPEALAVLDPVHPGHLHKRPQRHHRHRASLVEGVHGPRTLIVIIAG